MLLTAFHHMIHTYTHKIHYLVILMGRVACHWRVAGPSQMVYSWLLQHGHTTPSTLLWNMQVCEHNEGIHLFRHLTLNCCYKISMPIPRSNWQTVSQTLLLQMTTQGNSDASNASCRGPMRSQRKAPIMYFLQYHFMVYQVSHIFIWSN